MNARTFLKKAKKIRSRLRRAMPGYLLIIKKTEEAIYCATLWNQNEDKAQFILGCYYCQSNDPEDKKWTQQGIEALFNLNRHLDRLLDRNRNSRPANLNLAL